MTHQHFLTIIVILWTAIPALPASAEAPSNLKTSGFGSVTTGGIRRNGSPIEVYSVSSLSDSGPGSLRAAVSASGPRVVVFTVSGSIRLKSPLVINKPYLTVAGETAPSPGIAIIGDRSSIETHDVVIRHVRFFVGDSPGPTDGSQRDALTIFGNKHALAERVVIDHCYLGGAVDENFSTNGAVRDITLSNSIIANSLDLPISSARHAEGEHGKGVLIGDGTKNYSILRSLIANNQDRNPRIKQGSQGEMVNCVVYGWGGVTGWNVLNFSDPKPKERKPSYANIIGNTYVAGPDGRCDIPFMYSENIVPGSRIFLKDNSGPRCGTGTGKASEVEGAFLTSAEALPSSPGLTVLPREEAYEHVLRNAGPRPAENYKGDTDLIHEVIERTGRIKKGIWGYRKKDIRFPKLRKRHRKLVLPAGATSVSPDGRVVLERWLGRFAAKVEKPRTY